MTAHIRVVRVPPGEAPFWVRDKWVGLHLPLAQETAVPATFRTAGVVTGPKSVLATLLAFVTGKLARETGFLVDVETAVSVLRRTSPEAAAWWREKAPHLVQPNRYFVFPENVAVIEQPNAQPANGP